MSAIIPYLKKGLFFILFCLLVQACNVHSSMRTDHGRNARKDLKFIETDSMFQRQFTGVSLYSISDEKWLIDYNADKLFTPASNTKTLTLYAALEMLPDSLITFYYLEKGDTLYILPNADPTFLHPDFPENKALEFLDDWPGQVAVAESQKENNLYFGSGWAWDDYAYYFQTEISDFPLFGNSIYIENKDSQLIIMPPLFRDSITYVGEPEKPKFSRDLRKNSFYLVEDRTLENRIQVPFVTSPELAYKILADTLNKEVSGVRIKLDPNLLSPFYGIAKDTVLRKLMHQSDNFIAEQLLKMIGNQLKVQSTAEILNIVQDSLFSFKNDQFRWVDGSGLSRYNLFTPRFFTQLLLETYGRTGMEGIKYYFPAGGESGTIKNNYSSGNGTTPYVYAKTGTMSNNHSLSGYLITDKNNLLAFSIMNNHYYGSSSTVKPSMEKLLLYFKGKY